MSFKDIVEKYKAGIASEEEMRLIEEELEKQKWLNELLYDDLESELEDLGDVLHGSRNASDGASRKDAAATDDAQRFARVIQRAIRRAFIKAGVVILAIGVALTLFLCYGLSPIVDSMYYDPAEEVILHETENSKVTTERLGTDMGVYTELNYPLVRFDGANVTERGFGEYSFQLYQSYLPVGMNSDRISGEIQRGIMTMYDSNVLKRIAVNEFANYAEDGTVNRYHRQEWQEYSEADVRKDVAQMDGEVDERKLAYVSFDHILNFDEIWQLKDETGVRMAWNLVDVSGSRNSGNGWSSSSGDSFGYWDAYSFNNLVYGEEVKDDPTSRLIPEGMEYEEFQRNETLQTEQFLKMLDYMGEQEEFLDMMGDWPDMYPEAAACVREHGMNFIGMAVYGSQEVLTKLLDHPLVAIVYLEDR